jgi:hypothetical protein
MKRILIAFFLFTVNLYSQDGQLIRNPIRNIPKWVRGEISAQHLDQQYTVVYQLYPYYLRGDFNGDGKRDVAIQVVEKSSGKSGIAIFRGKRRQRLITIVSILGAGKTIGSIGDDFKWMNIWNIHRKGEPIESSSQKSPTLIGDAILIEKRDSTSGLIYWDGKKYTWYYSKK